MDGKPCGSGKLVQTILPELGFIPVTAAAISKQEDWRGLGILLASDTSPPAGQRSDGKFGRGGIDANLDEALFFQDSVDALGNGFFELLSTGYHKSVPCLTGRREVG
jgi:hypothetical protein